MEPLKQMAALAVEEHLKGRSFKRNSILKPLDIILEILRENQKRMYVILYGVLRSAIFLITLIVLLKLSIN